MSSLERWLKITVSSSPPPFLKEIIENYTHDYGELWAITAAPNVHGWEKPRRRGVGKSVLGIKLLIHTYYRVYGRLPTWDDIKQFIFFRPSEFVRLVLHLRDKKARVPVVIWDDAGEWLFRSRAREKFITRIAESLEVIRTVISNLFFTCTSVGKLARGVRESLGYIITVGVVSDKVRADGTVVKVSRARVYYATEDLEWLFKRREMPKPIYEWVFKVWLPDEIYKNYLEYRASFVDVGVKRVWSELRKLSKKEEEEEREVVESEEELEEGLRELAKSVDMH